MFWNYRTSQRESREFSISVGLANSCVLFDCGSFAILLKAGSVIWIVNTILSYDSVMREGCDTFTSSCSGLHYVPL